MKEISLIPMVSASDVKSRLSFLSCVYSVAFTMRSGSNQICEYLSQNKCGNPTELFQNGITDWNGTCDNEIESLIRTVSQHTRRSVFGSKMTHDQRALLDEQLRSAISDYRNLNDIFPNHRWIWLIRRDKIRQAISLCRAEESGVWVGHREMLSPKIKYNYRRILSRIMRLYAADLAWKTYFEKHSIVPYIIYYEQFFTDLPTNLAKLLQYIGAFNAIPKMEGSLKMITDYSNERLRQMFIDDLIRAGEKKFEEEWPSPIEWNKIFFG